LVDYIELVRLLGDETDPEVWSAMLAPFRTFSHILTDRDRPALEAFVRRLVGPALERLGWDPAPDEPERTGTLRAILVKTMGGLGPGLHRGPRSAPGRPLTAADAGAPGRERGVRPA